MEKKVISRDVDGGEHVVAVADLKLDVHVYGIAVKEGKVLVVPQFGGYDYPGGTLELGESHIEALKREFKEETGYEVEPVRLLNIYTSFFHHKKRGEDYQSLLVYYVVEITGGELSKDGFSAGEQEYAERAEWVPIEELKQRRHACSVDIAEELVGFVERVSLEEGSRGR